jgi:hypothetical protein
MKLVSMADLVTLFLCPQEVSKFKHGIGVMADLATLLLCSQDVSDFEHEIHVNG